MELSISLRRFQRGGQIAPWQFVVRETLNCSLRLPLRRANRLGPLGSLFVVKRGWERGHQLRNVRISIRIEFECGVHDANTNRESAHQYQWNERVETYTSRCESNKTDHHAEQGQQQERNGGDSAPELIGQKA